MSKTLNLLVLKEAMAKRGLNASDLARELDVSREAASKWLQGKSLPRPNKLLKIALRLGLTFDQLIQPEHEDTEPVVAFRKMGARKTTERHIVHAREMGRLLRPLVPYLPFDSLVRPPTLKQPVAEYDYLQEVVNRVRAEIGVSDHAPLDFRHLVKKFGELQAVLIPVLWGRKDRHENALHIFLPDSMTTWVYLNLDSEVHDFKFWMAHELGHILTPELRGDAAENFADAFAGALLFPAAQAEAAWRALTALRSPGKRMNRIKAIADEQLISPITVLEEVNRCAQRHGWERFEFGSAIYGAAKNLSKAYHNVAESLFSSQPVDPAAYVHTAEQLFQTAFFGALKRFLVDSGKGHGYVQSILDIGLLDARSLHRYLV